MFHTEVILPSDATYIADQKLPFGDDHCITLDTLENLDQSKFDKVATLPLTLPEMIIGEYLVANTNRFNSMELCNGKQIVSKHRIVIDGREMANMYMSVRMHYLMLTGENRVYVSVVTTEPVVTVHVTRVDYTKTKPCTVYPTTTFY